MTTIYHYSPTTFELVGQSTADNDPLDDLPMIPALTTLDAPPVTGANKTAKWIGSAWDIVDDYRGYIGYDVAGDEQKIDTLGMAPNPTWLTTRPFILDEALVLKRDDIRSAFTAAEQLPVTDGNGIVWSGGYDSALKMDAAKRMAQMAGLPNVVLFDDANVAHDLTIAEADVVILTVGADYQSKFAQKQALMIAVDALPGSAMQTDVDAVVVAF